MSFKFISTLLNERQTSINAKFDGRPICPSNINGVIASISKYDMVIYPNYNGEYRSGRQGSPDNWHEDEHPELENYTVNADMVTVIISVDEKTKFDVVFIGESEGKDLEEVFSKLIQNGKVLYHKLNAEGNFEDAPDVYHEQLFNTAKHYILNNTCYNDTIIQMYI